MATTEIEKIYFQFGIETKDFNSSITGMRKEILKLKGLVGNSLLSKEQELQVSQRLGHLQDQMEDVAKAAKNISTKDVFGNMARFAGVASSAIAGVASAMSLLGVESEKVGEIERKILQFMALGNALQQIADSDRLRGLATIYAGKVKNWMFGKKEVEQIKETQKAQEGLSRQEVTTASAVAASQQNIVSNMQKTTTSYKELSKNVEAIKKELVDLKLFDPEKETEIASLEKTLTAKEAQLAECQKISKIRQEKLKYAGTPAGTPPPAPIPGLKSFMTANDVKLMQTGVRTYEELCAALSECINPQLQKAQNNMRQMMIGNKKLAEASQKDIDALKKRYDNYNDYVTRQKEGQEIGDPFSTYRDVVKKAEEYRKEIESMEKTGFPVHPFRSEKGQENIKASDIKNREERIALQKEWDQLWDDYEAKWQKSELLKAERAAKLNKLKNIYAQEEAANTTKQIALEEQLNATKQKGSQRTANWNPIGDFLKESKLKSQLDKESIADIKEQYEYHKRGLELLEKENKFLKEKVKTDEHYGQLLERNNKYLKEAKRVVAETEGAGFPKLTKDAEEYLKLQEEIRDTQYKIESFSQGVPDRNAIRDLKEQELIIQKEQLQYAEEYDKYESKWTKESFKRQERAAKIAKLNKDAQNDQINGLTQMIIKTNELTAATERLNAAQMKSSQVTRNMMIGNKKLAEASQKDIDKLREKYEEALDAEDSFFSTKKEMKKAKAAADKIEAMGVPKHPLRGDFYKQSMELNTIEDIEAAIWRKTNSHYELMGDLLERTEEYGTTVEELEKSLEKVNAQHAETNRLVDEYDQKWKKSELLKEERASKLNKLKASFDVSDQVGKTNNMLQGGDKILNDQNLTIANQNALREQSILAEERLNASRSTGAGILASQNVALADQINKTSAIGGTGIGGAAQPTQEAEKLRDQLRKAKLEKLAAENEIAAARRSADLQANIPKMSTQLEQSEFNRVKAISERLTLEKIELEQLGIQGKELDAINAKLAEISKQGFPPYPTDIAELEAYNNEMKRTTLLQRERAAKVQKSGFGGVRPIGFEMAGSETLKPGLVDQYGRALNSASKETEKLASATEKVSRQQAGLGSSIKSVGSSILGFTKNIASSVGYMVAFGIVITGLYKLYDLLTESIEKDNAVLETNKKLLEELKPKMDEVNKQLREYGKTQEEINNLNYAANIVWAQQNMKLLENANNIRKVTLARNQDLIASMTQGPARPEAIAAITEQNEKLEKQINSSDAVINQYRDYINKIWEIATKPPKKVTAGAGVDVDIDIKAAQAAAEARIKAEEDAYYRILKIRQDLEKSIRELETNTYSSAVKNRRIAEEKKLRDQLLEIERKYLEKERKLVEQEGIGLENYGPLVDARQEYYDEIAALNEKNRKSELEKAEEATQKELDDTLNAYQNEKEALISQREEINNIINKTAPTKDGVENPVLTNAKLALAANNEAMLKLDQKYEQTSLGIIQNGEQAKYEVNKKYDELTLQEKIKFNDELITLDDLRISMENQNVEIALRNREKEFKYSNAYKKYTQDAISSLELQRTNLIKLNEEEVKNIKLKYGAEEAALRVAMANNQLTLSLADIEQQIRDITAGPIPFADWINTENWADPIKGFAENLGSLTQQTADAALSIMNSNLEAQRAMVDRYISDVQKATDNSLENLDRLYKANYITAFQYEKRKEEIERERDNRIARAREEQFRKEQNAAATTAIIQGALAIVQAYGQLGPIGGTIAAVLIAAVTAAQISTIKSQPVPEYEKGGLIEGPSHKQGGVKAYTPNGLVELEGGEYIVNKKAVQKPGMLQTLNKLNKYQYGGQIMGTHFNQDAFRNVQQPPIINNNVNTQTIDMDELATAVVKAIKQIPVNVVETDITRTQRKVNVIEKRSSW